MKHVYFVLYGEFIYKHGDNPFGERCGLGWTIGEEVLYDKQQPLKRYETVVAKRHACLL